MDPFVLVPEIYPAEMPYVQVLVAFAVQAHHCSHTASYTRFGLTTPLRLSANPS